MSCACAELSTRRSGVTDTATFLRGRRVGSEHAEQIASHAVLIVLEHGRWYGSMGKSLFGYLHGQRAREAVESDDISVLHFRQRSTVQTLR